MKLTFGFTFTVVMTTMLFGLSTCVHSQEKKITEKDLPAAVKSAFHKSYPHATIKGLAKETENGKTYYEIESIDGKLHRDLLYTPEGDAYEIEETISPGKL